MTVVVTASLGVVVGVIIGVSGGRQPIATEELGKTLPLLQALYNLWTVKFEFHAFIDLILAGHFPAPGNRDTASQPSEKIIDS